MPPDTKLLGAWGEDLTCEYLRRRGWRIVDRNFSCRFGELDVVAAKQGITAMVEVKLRKSARYGAAAEFVTPAKQRRLRLAAECWLSRHPTDDIVRFDVMEIYAPEGLHTKKPILNRIEGAFE